MAVASLAPKPTKSAPTLALAAPVLSAGQTLRDLAEHRKLEMSQATLVWLLGHSPAMLPIPGTSSLAHLEENVAAARLRFSADEMRRIG